MDRAGRAVDADWLSWLRTNVSRGCSHEELRGILLKEGFDERSIRRAFREVLSGAPPAPAPEQLPTATLNVPRLSRFESSEIELYMAEDFLDPAHCTELIRLIKAACRPSTISEPPAGEADKMFRTSRTCDLLGKDAATERLDAMICAALGWESALAEPSQGQYYEVGQEFKAHTDFFKDYELEKYTTAAWGQRTWTFMIYLNEPEAGGETRFVDLDLTIRPKRGMAVLWNNLLATGGGNPKTRHTGMPVLAGTKFIITKWFRLPRSTVRPAFSSARYSWTQSLKG